jgi:hypothetical protein
VIADGSPGNPNVSIVATAATLLCMTVIQVTLVFMDFDRLDEVVSPQEQAAGLHYHRTALQRLHEPHHHGNVTVREVAYGTHTIRVITSYDIEVDGQPVTGHLLVTNEGSLHYHAIPNQEFPSALDMVKRMIDLAPDQFPDPSGNPTGHQGHDGDHAHHDGDHAHHDGDHALHDGDHAPHNGIHPQHG